jgi:Mlc titration factor MtfA (ptsG expression regulator)
MLDLVNGWLPRRWRRLPPIPESLWQQVLTAFPFLQTLNAAEHHRLQQLCSHFLLEKEFHPANGLTLDDAMALAIAAQACLPLLHMHGPSGQPAADPLDLLDWYGDFVGIVVQPGAVVARRKTTDGAGVVHHYHEVLAGEAMDRGPIMLSWDAVAPAADADDRSGSNVVIHEFVHKMDMRNSRFGDSPDGAPPLPQGFLGRSSAQEARTHWRQTMQQHFEAFSEAVAMAERFGGDRPWLDAYAATHPAEFFAVTCEAYFVSRARFGEEFPLLLSLYDGFFRPRKVHS